jgi:hypothetical protein
MKAKRSALRLATHVEFGLLFFADGGEDRATRVNVGMRDHLATKGTWAIKRNFSIRRRHLTRRSQPPLWERGCATTKNTLIKIDIDAQRQRAVGCSAWLGVPLRWNTALLMQ